MTANEKLKEKILTDLFLTGKVNGQYMTKTPKNNDNPLKHYIKMKLEAYYKIFNEQQYYIDEIYSTLFLELSKIDADKFVKEFGDNTHKLTATACRIILLKGFYKLIKPVKVGKDLEGNYIIEDLVYHKHSTMTNLLFASSLDQHDENVISHVETVRETDRGNRFTQDADTDHLIRNVVIYDVEDEDTFHDQYNVTAAEIVAELSPEEKDLFYMLASGRKGRKQVQQSIKDLKEKLNLIKRKLTRTMTEQDLYNVLKPLELVFAGYKNKTLSALSADQIEQIKLGYQTMQQVYPNVLPRIFTTSCSSCIISTLEQFIMTYDRLKLTYHVDEPEVIETPVATPKAAKKGKKKDD